MRVPLVLYGTVLCVCLGPIVSAQDAVKVDPQHYKVVSEKRKGKKQSVPNGDWIFYDKTGKEISRITYKNGVKK